MLVKVIVKTIDPENYEFIFDLQIFRLIEKIQQMPKIVLHCEHGHCEWEFESIEIRNEVFMQFQNFLASHGNTASDHLLIQVL